jgi:hypothetical protein
VWFWPDGDVTELVSGTPAPQSRDEDQSWFRVRAVPVFQMIDVRCFRVPPGLRIPQVEDRCKKGYGEVREGSVTDEGNACAPCFLISGYCCVRLDTHRLRLQARRSCCCGECVKRASITTNIWHEWKVPVTRRAAGLGGGDQSVGLCPRRQCRRFSWFSRRVWVCVVFCWHVASCNLVGKAKVIPVTEACRVWDLKDRAVSRQSAHRWLGCQPYTL